jgi:hypothetical protein
MQRKSYEQMKAYYKKYHTYTYGTGRKVILRNHLENLVYIAIKRGYDVNQLEKFIKDEWTKCSKMMLNNGLTGCLVLNAYDFKHLFNIDPNDFILYDSFYYRMFEDSERQLVKCPTCRYEYTSDFGRNSNWRYSTKPFKDWMPQNNEAVEWLKPMLHKFTINKIYGPDLKEHPIKIMLNYCCTVLGDRNNDFEECDKTAFNVFLAIAKTIYWIFKSFDLDNNLENDTPYSEYVKQMEVSPKKMWERPSDEFVKANEQAYYKAYPKKGSFSEMFDPIYKKYGGWV